MIDPMWEKKFNLATINIQTIMLTLQEKWSANANRTKLQSETNGYPEQAGQSSRNIENESGSGQTVNGAGNQNPTTSKDGGANGYGRAIP